MFCVYYSKKSFENWKAKESLPTSEADVQENFVMVRTFDNIIYHTKDEFVKNLEKIFFDMQGENWSPNGEKRTFIRESGLDHTSMSVGDFIYDGMTGFGYFCDKYGWKKFNINNPSVELEK